MYKNQKIVYKNIQIDDLETFKQTLNVKYCLNNPTEHPTLSYIGTTNLTIKSVLSELIRKESLLFQQMNLHSDNVPAFFKRDYTFLNMLQTEKVLELLDLLETVKYSSYYTYARKLLQRYLHLSYDLSSCTLLKTMRKSIATFNLWKSDNPNLYSNRELLQVTEEYNQPSPSKTIRQHLAYFLSTTMNSYNFYGNFGLYKNAEPPQKSKASDKLKERFYIPAYEIPSFLLLFTYFDGRDFQRQHKQKSKYHLPQYNKERSCSEFSYQLVKEKLKTLCPSPSPTQSPYAALDISTFICCDNIFLYTKLNRLTYYYNLYLSDSVLTTIMQQYNLTYSEVIELDKFLIKNIFEDKNFIIAGLRSNYVDFMLPFDILFRSAILLNSSGQSSYSDFKSKLDTIKHSTLELYTDIFYKYNPPILSFHKSGALSITSSEEEILKYLMNDNFYKNCYCFKCFTEKNSTLTNDNARDFSPKFNTIIKKALDIPKF